MPSSGGSRRVRVERGIYRQKNGKYAVCVRVDGRARFRTLEAATLVEALRQREALQRAGRLGDLPLSPRLTFAEVAGRWLAEFEAKVTAGERRDRAPELFPSPPFCPPPPPPRPPPPPPPPTPCGVASPPPRAAARLAARAG